MFTIKYRTYVPTEANDGSYYRHEQLHGPFALVSQEWIADGQVVYAHRTDDAPGMTFAADRQGPGVAGRPIPGPELYVMNESGATVAHYNL